MNLRDQGDKMSDNGDNAKDAATESTAVKSKGGGGAVFFAVLLSTVAAGAMVVGSPYWTPYAEKYIRAPNPLKALQGETAKLGQAVADLDAKSNAAASETAKLKEQTAALASARIAAVAMANTQLRARIASGDSYEYELAALRIAAKGDAELKPLIDSLEPYAASGAPTRVALRESFPHAVAAVVATEAETAAKSAAGWFGGFGALVGQLGYVLQVTTPPEGGVHSTVRQARVRLSAGDLAGAVDEMSNLPEPRVIEASTWIAAAKARLIADKADTGLTTIILGRLTSIK